MAAGIGEASAILSIAQIGVKLSKSLITYIEEVKGAPSHIQRIGNEILTTSERLKDIGELVEKNPQTKVLSEGGINSAIRCSTECQHIIEEVKNVLYKGGWQDYPKESDKDQFDTSLFSNLRWPFVKIKLEVSRAELHRIKLDLSLLFSAAMFLGASTATERQRLAQDIPELHKARAWAAKRAEKVKEMAQYQIKNSRARDMPWSDDEPEMLEEFLTFKERLFFEEEEKRIRDRAQIIQAEDDARKQKEDDAQREVERKAVEEYKKTQRDQEIRSAEKRDNFRKELERLGLESAQVQLVMDSSNLDFQAASGTAIVPEVQPSASLKDVSSEQEATHSATSGWSRINLPWRRPKRSTRESSSESPLSSMLLENSSALQPELEFETWLLDFATQRNAELLPSADWLLEKLKSIKKDQDVWSRFARLKPYWKSRIFAFLEFQRQESPGWTLYYLETSDKRPRTRLFSQRHDDQSMLLILCRRRANDQDSDVPEGGPKADGPSGLPKRVTFVEGVGEESSTDKGLNDPPNDTFARNTSSLKEQIARLEERRNGLDDHDHDRITDLTEMIGYLQDQLKLVGTQTGNPNTQMFHDERQPHAMRSKANGASMPIRQEYMPNTSPGDELVIHERTYSRGPSPPPSPPRRPNNTGEVSIVPRYPRETIKVIERDFSPRKREYEDQDGFSNHSRYGHHSHRSLPAEEDVIIIRRDDRVSRRGSPGRSRSRSRPSWQDSFDTYEEPLTIRRRERSWERSRPRPPQVSRQPSRVTDKHEYSERRLLANATRPVKRTSEGDEEGWSHEMRDIVIRRDGSSKPKPRKRHHFYSSESEYSYHDPITYRRKSVVDSSAQSQALVLRAGASRHPYDYVRERVLNGGIRVRGENDVYSPPSDPAVSKHVRRAYRPLDSRRNSLRDRSWAPSLRRAETWHQFDSSGDEQSRYRSTKMVASEKDNPETELNDAEVIAQTLKQYTTIQDSDIATTGVSAPSFRTEKAPETAVGRSAMKEAPQASSGSDSKKSFSVPGRKAHFEKENDARQPDQDGLGKATNERSNSVDEISFLEKGSVEPDAVNEDNDIPHHQQFVSFSSRPAPPRPQRRSFPLPSDRAPSSHEVLPQFRSRDSTPDSRAIRPANGPTIFRHDSEEIQDHATHEEAYDEVEIIRTISRNPTVYEEVD